MSLCHLTGCSLRVLRSAPQSCFLDPQSDRLSTQNVSLMAFLTLHLGSRKSPVFEQGESVADLPLVLFASDMSRSFHVRRDEIFAIFREACESFLELERNGGRWL